MTLSKTAVYWVLKFKLKWEYFIPLVLRIVSLLDVKSTILPVTVWSVPHSTEEMHTPWLKNSVTGATANTSLQ